MKVRKTSMIWLKVCFLVLLFQSLIVYIWNGNIIGTFVSYFDEMVEIVAIAYLFSIGYIKKRLPKSQKRLLLLLLLLNIIGIISTAKNHINSFFPTFVDMLNCNKFVIIFVATTLYIKRNKQISTFLFSLNRIMKLIVYILCALVFINVFVVQIFPVRDYRIFMYSQMLMWKHPGEFAAVLLVCFFVLLYNSKKYNNDICMIIASLGILSTMRIRLLAAVVIAWMMYFYFIKFKIKRQWFLIICIVITAALIGYDQFSIYYTGSDQARYLLAFNAIKFANNGFPFGTGFASYGTNMARQYYSPLYSKLGFGSVWGLNIDNDTFLTDQFWPSIIAQFGWIGLIVFVLIILHIYGCIRDIKQKDIFGYTAGLTVFSYEILTSLGETAYFSPLCVIVFFIIALCISADNEIQSMYRKGRNIKLKG